MSVIAQYLEEPSASLYHIPAVIWIIRRSDFKHFYFLSGHPGCSWIEIPFLILEGLVFSSMWTLSLSEEGWNWKASQLWLQQSKGAAWAERDLNFPAQWAVLTPLLPLNMFSLHSGHTWEILTPSFAFIITHEPLFSLYPNTTSHFGLNSVLFSSGKLSSRSGEKRSWVEEKKRASSKKAADPSCCIPIWVLFCLDD